MNPFVINSVTAKFRHIYQSGILSKLYQTHLTMLYILIIPTSLLMMFKTEICSVKQFKYIYLSSLGNCRLETTSTTHVESL